MNSNDLHTLKSMTQTDAQPIDGQRSGARHQRLTVMDLKQAGLTDAQIDRLEALATTTPWREFMDSTQEWHRLLFCKWCYQTGRLES